MKTQAGWVGVVMLGISAMSGHAQSLNDTVYLGAGLGQASANELCNFDVGDGESKKCDKTGLAKTVFLGYRFNQYAAFEFDYHTIDAQASTISNVDDTGTGSKIKRDVTFKGVGLNIVGSYPVNERFSLLGLAGWSRNSVEDRVKSYEYTSGDVVASSREVDKKTSNGPLLAIGGMTQWRDAEFRLLYKDYLDVDSGMTNGDGKKLEPDIKIIELEAALHFSAL